MAAIGKLYKSLEEDPNDKAVYRKLVNYSFDLEQARLVKKMIRDGGYEILCKGRKPTPLPESTIASTLTHYRGDDGKKHSIRFVFHPKHDQLRAYLGMMATQTEEEVAGFVDTHNRRDLLERRRRYRAYASRISGQTAEVALADDEVALWVEAFDRFRLDASYSFIRR